MQYRWGGVLFFVISAALRAQAPADSTFRATTRLVQVSVIAQDQDSKPITTLRREDFQIFDNGAPQEIRLFLADKPAPMPTEARTPNAFTNRIGGASGAHAVILFDNLATEFAYTAAEGARGTGYARRKALEMLQTIPEEDPIAIYALWYHLQIIREFTTDRDSLIRELTAMGGSVTTPSKNNCAPNADFKGEAPSRLSNTPPFRMMNQRALGECQRIDGRERADSIDQELQQIADHLAGIPGRKSLIWIAGQFPVTPAALEKLNNAGVAIYPVDAHGARVLLPRDKKDLAAPLQALAAMTGGVAYFDRDDLDVAIREALDDGRVSYTLGFYQTGGDEKPTVHQLAVRINRPGIILRYRTSYQTEPQAPAPASPVADLVAAMNRPADATAIPVKATAIRKEDSLDLTVSLDPSSLDLEMSGGLWKGKAEFVARFTTAEGVLAGDVLAQTVTFNLRPATYEASLRSGVPYHEELKIPANAVELKLLVGTLGSGKMGTLTIPLSEIVPEEAAKK